MTNETNGGISTNRHACARNARNNSIGHVVWIACSFMVVLSWATSLSAQDDADIKLVEDRAEKFLQDLSKDPTAAFKRLLANSKLAGTDEIERLTAAAKELPSKYGAFLAAERIDSRKIGDDLVLLTYLYKAENFPLVWRFAFYRPADKWGVVSLRFDSKLLDLNVQPSAR